MSLDLETAYVVTAIACFVLGSIQLGAFASGRFGRWPLLWGLSDLLIGLGMIGVTLRQAIPFHVAVFVFNALSTGGFLLMLMAVRSFAGRASHWRILGLGTALVTVPALLIWNEPGDYAARIAVLSPLCVIFDLSVVHEGIRLARRERLTSAWFLVGLFALTGTMFIVRALLAFTGRLGGSELFAAAPPVQQWMAATATVCIALRGITLILMAAERNAQTMMALAQSDTLTGALNRGGLRDWFEKAVRNRTGDIIPMALLLVDIDHFKSINDTCGHAAGDEILKAFAAVARSRMGPSDALGRHGGDEFVLLRPAPTIEAAARWAEEIRDAFVAAVNEARDLAIRPTLSIGVAQSSVGKEGLDDLLRLADEALYRSKRQGRNRIEWQTATESLAA